MLFPVVFIEERQLFNGWTIILRLYKSILVMESFLLRIFFPQRETHLSNPGYLGDLGNSSLQ